MKVKKLFAAFFIMLLNIVIIGSVYAETLPNCPPRYEENPFTDEDCLDADDNSWRESTKGGYRLNTETGEFELVDTMTAQSTNIASVHYGLSNDKKTLYAYVPNYSQQVQSAKDSLNQLGIITTSTCDATLRVEKTAVGMESEVPAPPVPPKPQEPCTVVDGKYYDKNGEEVDRETYERECSAAPTTTTTRQSGPVTPTTRNPGEDQIIDTPNTASTASVVSIALGTVAIAGGGYALMRKFEIPIKIGKDK